MEWLQTHCLKTKRIFVGIGNKPITIWRQKMVLSSVQSRRWIMLKCKCKILGDRLRRRNSRKLWLLSHQRFARQMCRNSIVLYLSPAVRGKGLFLKSKWKGACLLEKRGFSLGCVPIVPVVPINFEWVCIFGLSVFFTSLYYITY